MTRARHDRAGGSSLDGGQEGLEDICKVRIVSLEVHNKAAGERHCRRSRNSTWDSVAVTHGRRKPADPKGGKEVDRWALFVAVLALASTAYSFFRQHGLQQRLAAIDEDRRREEVASSLEAEVGARFESQLSGPTPRLRTISSSSATPDKPGRKK